MIVMTVCDVCYAGAVVYVMCDVSNVLYVRDLLDVSDVMCEMSMMCVCVRDVCMCVCACDMCILYMCVCAMYIDVPDVSVVSDVRDVCDVRRTECDVCVCVRHVCPK